MSNDKDELTSYPSGESKEQNNPEQSFNAPRML